MHRSARPRLRIAAILVAAAAANLTAARAAGDHATNMRASLELFRSDVRRALTDNCVSCHGGAKVRGGFNLTTREGLLAGGENGLAVTPGRSDRSPLVGQLAHRARPFMPPDEPPMPPSTVAKIARWIDLGAAYDGPLVAPKAKRAALEVTDEHRAWWAYRPLRTDFPPDAGIDRFVRDGHRAHKLKPAGPAPKRTLIRRLHFDLTGLPPEPEAVEAFVGDQSPGAYERQVDALLASPAFGERWARHWLDVARFAESHGFEHDYDRKHAFHYRDFVVRAFNADMPYDRFVRWQIAGDEIAPDDPSALMATGFLAAGVHSTQITIRDAERSRYDAMDDMLATTGSAMLATTIGCARCHDHKFDPIPTRDYYRMLSAFTSTVRSEVQLDLSELDGAAAADGGEEAVRSVMIASEGEHILPLRLHKTSHDIPDFYPATHFLARGDPQQKAGVAEPGFLGVLTRGAGRWPARSNDPRTSGRRTALAQWLTDTGGGAGELLARVIVNRLWQHHFGRGIVASPDDFGTQGEAPTHPELLDWLAGELIRGGWRLKPIHKAIVMSDAYRRGSSADARNAAADPDNRFLWHRPPRRLEAEAIRDSALAASGLLERRMFGRGTLDPGSPRRSLYLTVKRSRLVPALQMFDAPDGLTSLGRRTVTTSAPQALVLLNDPSFRDMAEAFAARIAVAPDRVGQAYAIAYGRPPSADERRRGEAFLDSGVGASGGEGPRLADFCAALMAGSEFLYVD